jgi:hypothetical protein
MTEVQLSTRDDCIYAAGLFDGEGSAVLTNRKIKNRRDAEHPYRAVVVYASVANTYLPVLAWIKERWGGTISATARTRAGDRRLCFIWNTSSKNAGVFLSDIAPFVRIKRDQVENALAFQATKRLRGSKRLSDAEWQTALDFLHHQRGLNGRGKNGAGEVWSEAHGSK